MALEAAPWTVSMRTQFFRPTVNGRMARSEAELSIGTSPLCRMYGDTIKFRLTKLWRQENIQDRQESLPQSVVTEPCCNKRHGIFLLSV